jgi:hypothetical protein
MTDTNKRLLISKSHGDSNRCTPCRKKSDQHATHIPHSVRVWFQTLRISRGQRIATFRESPIDLDGSHCSWEKVLPTQSPSHRSTDPRVRTQFLSQNNQWSSKLKSSFCRWRATTLTGPISPACDRYVQYLLTDTNPSVLNRHRWGLPHRNLRIATTLSPPFPSECSTGPPNWPRSVSRLSKIYQLNQSLSFKETYGRHVVFRQLGHLP